MAQYLPYIPEVFPEPALYRPDFNFFDRMLQRKQSQFEQGLNQVKSAYNSVLNAPLSDKANIPLRDAYIKQAQESLKILGSSDLSLPQNIQTANSVFSPFWEDQFITQDAALTKWYQSEASKLASWRDSPDEKVRAKYNGISMMYLNNGLSALQNANRNSDAYAKVEKRQAVPFTNIEEYLQDQAKADKLEIKYDDPNGPYLVETVNGQRSQKKYSVWAQSMIGNNFYDQFRVTGIVEKEERAKAIKRTNPNLSEQEIGNIIAKDVVSELQQGFKKRTNEIDVELARVDSLITSVAQANNPGNQNLFDSLISERANLLARKEAVNEEYKNFDKESKDRLFNIVVGNPDAYFATLAKQRLVDNWATGRAGIEQKLIKENSAYTAAENLKLRRMEYDLNAQKAVWDRDQDLWERENPTAGKKSAAGTKLKDANGNDIEPPVLGQDKENSLIYRGFSGIDITRNQATALDLFNQLQAKDFNESHSLIFDQMGILGLAKNLGLDEAEIAHVATALQREVATNGGHSFTKEQVAASNKLTAALLANQGVKNASITKITGPGTMRNALIAYAQDYISQRNNLSRDGNDVPLNRKEFEALMRYMTAVEKLNRYSANEKNRETLIQKNIVSNKEYASLLVDRGGKKDLITISDLAKDMPTMELREKASNELRKFSKEDVARLYMTGKLSGTQMGELIIDGKVYIPEKLNDISGGFAGRNPIVAWNNMYADVLTPKYGESSDFAKLLEKANQAVVPDLLMYRNKSGKQGTAWTLYFMPTKTMGQGDRAAQIVDQALNMANADIYDNNENPKQLDTKTMDAIRALLKSEKNMEDFIGAEYVPQGLNGKRTLRITFSKAMPKESAAAIGGLDLASISGKTFNVVINDGATAPALDALPKSTGYQVHDIIARGKVFKSDPVIEASGFKFAITPNVITSDGTADEEPTYVTVDLQYNARENKKDPKTGQITTVVEPKSISQVIQLTGPTAKSPDEIVEYLYDLYYQNMLDNRNRQQEYQSYIKTNESALRADFNQQLKDLGLLHLIK